MALPSQVFLLDIPALSAALSSDDWTVFADKLFCDETLRKLGFGFQGDLQVLVATLPCLNQGLNNMAQVIDLPTLLIKLQRQNLAVAAGFAEHKVGLISQDLAADNSCLRPRTL